MRTVMGVSVAGHKPLLERDSELVRLRGAVAGARDGAGSAVVIDGPAGIGKTALVDAVQAYARDSGIPVISARGRELEREFAFGVARQLFEPTLRLGPPERRTALLAGAASLVAPLFGYAGSGDGATTHQADPSFGVVHGLYWLTANLAEEGGLVITVDDVHWADQPSLRFLAYLAARCHDLPLAMVIAVRGGEPHDARTLMATIDADPEGAHIEPAALTGSAVHQLIAAGLNETPDRGFTEACARATAGNPFLLQELTAELRSRHVQPIGDNSERIDRVRPASVSRAVVNRLARLGPDARTLARAVAVLEKADLRDAQALAALEPEIAATAADRLFSAQVLSSAPELSFLHPLLRHAVYETIPPAARAAGHRRAALLISERGVRGPGLGAHLLRSDPTGSSRIAELCRETAAEAMQSGDPVTAARLLSRAVAEPPPESSRAVVLGELGEAESHARVPDAGAHLTQALALTDDPALRARLVPTLAEWLIWNGCVDEANELLTLTIDELGPHFDPAQMAVLETMRTAMAALSPRLARGADALIPAVHRLAEQAGPAGHGLMIVEASWQAQRGRHDGEWQALMDRGLDGGRFVAEHSTATPVVDLAAAVLVLSDEVGRATALLRDMRAYATAHGSIRAHLNAIAWNSLLSWRQGGVTQAAEDARTALELGRRHEVVWTVLWASAVLGQALTELGQFDEADQILAAAPIEKTLGSPPTLHATLARGRLRLAQGRTEEAIADLRITGENMIVDNPSFLPWRSALALALADVPEAHALVSEELTRARTLGQPRGIAGALRAQARLLVDSDPVALLTEAVTLLRASPARLELAGTLCDLGAALRRGGARMAAREPLRESIELARECGSPTLGSRAQAELLATGARRRRDRFSGPDALTPSERRVAALAATGSTNREIAQSLFVTTKTVGTHLGHIYRKLDLQGPAAREQLAKRLADHTEQMPGPD